MGEEEEDSKRSLQNYLLAWDKVRKDIIIPLRFTENQFVIHCLLTTEEGEPSKPYDYDEAQKDPFWEKWNATMGEKIDSLDKNRTWDVVKKLEKVKVIG